MPLPERKTAFDVINRAKHQLKDLERANDGLIFRLHYKPEMEIRVAEISREIRKNARLIVKMAEYVKALEGTYGISGREQPKRPFVRKG